MRRIMAFNRVTADGYFSASDGNLDWVVPDEEIDAAGASRMPDTDTILFGRRTYQMFESFWPHALDDARTAPDPHAAGQRSPTMRAMATWIDEATKVVFSRTLSEVTWRNARLVHDFDPRAVAAMKSQPGKDIIIFGSGSIASLLTRHDLIDEYQFIVNPTILGSGRPLISGVSNAARLDLAESTAYRSGNVMLRYTRAGERSDASSH